MLAVRRLCLGTELSRNGSPASCLTEPRHSSLTVYSHSPHQLSQSDIGLPTSSKLRPVVGNFVFISHQSSTHQAGHGHGCDALTAAEYVEQAVAWREQSCQNCHCSHYYDPIPTCEAVPVSPEIHHHLPLNVDTQLGIVILTILTFLPCRDLQ